MCRWLPYSGSPVLTEDALYTPTHSLIDQSLHSRLGAEPTNGDGVGIGAAAGPLIGGLITTTISCGTILVSDLASGNHTYVLSMTSLIALALVGLGAATFLPANTEQRPEAQQALQPPHLSRPGSTHSHDVGSSPFVTHSDSRP